VLRLCGVERRLREALLWPFRLLSLRSCPPLDDSAPSCLAAFVPKAVFHGREWLPSAARIHRLASRSPPNVAYLKFGYSASPALHRRSSARPEEPRTGLIAGKSRAPHEGRLQEPVAPQGGQLQELRCGVHVSTAEAPEGPQCLVPVKKESSGFPTLQLAHEFQHLLDVGVVNTRADIARRYGMSWARVSQAMSLLKLPRSVRDHIASLPLTEQRRYTERRLREIVAAPTEEMQLEGFAKLRGALGRNDR
jgi:hypothetical protein